MNNPTDTLVFGETDLRQALANAATLGGSQAITFDPSVTGTITLGSGLTISSNVTITGPGVSSLTVSGGGPSSNFSVFTVNSGATVTISGLTITNGNADNGGGVNNQGTLTVSNCTFTADSAASFGGGLYSTGNATVTVEDSTFRDNHLSAYASFGAGICIDSGSLMVRGTTFDNNSAYYTGAVWSSGACTVEIHDTVFSNNTAYWGPAALDVSGYYETARVFDTTFVNNTVQSTSWPYSGGAITVDQYSDLTLTRCALTGNSGPNGGAVHAVHNSAVHITDCQLSGNNVLSGGQGGAIFNEWESTVDVTNSTIADNTGGGLYSRGDAGPVILTNVTVAGNQGGGINGYGSITLQNTIVAGNIASDGTTPADVTAALAPNSSYNLIGIGGSGGMIDGVNHNRVGVSNPGLVLCAITADSLRPWPCCPAARPSTPAPRRFRASPSRPPTSAAWGGSATSTSVRSRARGSR